MVTHRMWLRPLIPLVGAGLFLYASKFSLVDDSLVVGARLAAWPELNSWGLIRLLPFCVPLAGVIGAARLLVFPSVDPSVMRGVLLAAGLVGIALILDEAGAIIALKGGVPGAGSIFGLAGALLILTSALLPSGTVPTGKERVATSSRLLGPVAILLCVGVFSAALLSPWTTRPHPMRLVWWPPMTRHWIWSVALPAAIVVPIIVAALRMSLGRHLRQTEVGVALTGGIFATLLFVRVVGFSIQASETGPLGLPPTFPLEKAPYVGLAAGGLIVVAALGHTLILRRQRIVRKP